MKRKLIFPLLTLVLGVFILIIGILFRIQHWPYGALIAFSGFIIIALSILAVFIIMIISSRTKN